jgi:hypothetical protein
MLRKRSAVVLISGIAAFAPLVLLTAAFILMQFLSADAFGAFARFALIAMLLLVLGFIGFSIFTPTVPGVQKAFWALVLAAGNILALPVFYFFCIWRNAKFAETPRI